jgi:hypothetical protein
MSGTPASLPSAVAPLGLAGRFLVARRAGRRDLGGALFAAGLTAVYLAAMGGSRPLARRIGAWPSVAVVTAVTVAAAELVNRTATR